ncbi:hypothetical protein F5I97DRAFT_847649 [Phlebopus sp. FC_14]|nr:hypothetical protein F5I97DRAFT_847649 [Phlebopus sp. FC_14]
MAEKKPPEPSPAGGESVGSNASPPTASDQHVQHLDRTELVARAGAFLATPHIRSQDSDSKRTFLAEKGLTSDEIDLLLRELPPLVPPRAYPPLPPSNLPNLLIGIARIFTWLTGTSAIILFVYHRYLLPRLTESYRARHVLRAHQSALLSRLTDSIAALKVDQAQCYKDLPRQTASYEDPQYADCHTLNEFLARTQKSGGGQHTEDLPCVTILRCAVEELTHTREDADGISTEEIFHHLESKLPWLTGEEGAIHQNELWKQLRTCPSFTSSPPKQTPADSLPPDHPSRLLWKYVPPPTPSPPAVLTSLTSLQTSLPHTPKSLGTTSKSSPLTTATLSPAQRTLQVLSDFTGYITTQTYSFGISSLRGPNGSAENPLEDELRREIRALKGLVLNRRSFFPPARPSSEPSRVSQS